VTGAQISITYVPPLQAILGTQAVSLTDGFLIVAIGCVFFALLESKKQMRLTLRRRRWNP
jgi:hypothetical protein